MTNEPPNPPIPHLILIAAALADTNGIGKNNDLPWHIPSEMRYFNAVTTWLGRRVGNAYPDKTQGDTHVEDGQKPLNAVIMGRRTWDSMPDGFRPLKGRVNVVLTGSEDVRVEVCSRSTPETPTLAFPTLPEALTYLTTTTRPTNTFIIGGSHIYILALAHPSCSHVLLTRVKAPAPIECDTFFPEVDMAVFRKAREEELREVVGPMVPVGVQRERGLEYEFGMFVRR
ncbi:dihydrofolate reductase-like domain-containing protein [Fimicolochytrium jonesii]|uniref:dihydrofolate reductase-like domain-containing protein n=1 Tax=Fimicolochytrium jonesii TaxID=1396493 RepID=UPI0022FEB55D|nr:dihydrofolate reductase-like domain-containing protein [Fimicolochytrium jonesii]KAI8819420.1 dihydrofolate reductase-like domain-containing protein [Fimicolochytrium jonesii]